MQTLKEKLMKANRKIEELENKNKGKTREYTAVDYYLRLFTVHMKAIYKANTTLFKLDNSQSLGLSLLVNLECMKNSVEISAVQMKYIAFNKANMGDLIAVKTNADTLEVYYKMRGAQSPTVCILNNSQMRIDNSISYIEEDCETAIANLPARHSICSN